MRTLNIPVGGRWNRFYAEGGIKMPGHFPDHHKPFTPPFNCEDDKGTIGCGFRRRQPHPYTPKYDDDDFPHKRKRHNYYLYKRPENCVDVDRIYDTAYDYEDYLVYTSIETMTANCNGQWQLIFDSKLGAGILANKLKTVLNSLTKYRLCDIRFQFTVNIIDAAGQVVYDTGLGDSQIIFATVGWDDAQFELADTNVGDCICAGRPVEFVLCPSDWTKYQSILSGALCATEGYDTTFYDGLKDLFPRLFVFLKTNSSVRQQVQLKKDVYVDLTKLYIKGFSIPTYPEQTYVVPGTILR